MGRKSKGVSKINDAYCIEYVQVAKLGLIHKQPYPVEKNIEWRTEIEYEAVTIEGTYNATINQNQLKLSYIAFGADGIPIHLENIIVIEEISSNLGNGKVGYFLCPITRKRCRKLYKTEKSNNWQCREAFAERLYYPLQLCSKLDIYTARYKAYNLWIKKYEERKIVTKNKGVATKRQVLIRKLNEKKNVSRDLLESPLSYRLSIRKLMPEGLEDRFKRLYCKSSETYFE
jgi:hypothetical protein